jgi:deoxyadenosine/deoxycytidine kinase
MSILRISFGNIETVTGQSAYVNDLVEAIGTVTEIVQENIQVKKYLRNFYDKTVKYVLLRLVCR